jgi:hypothetical protein
VALRPELGDGEDLLRFKLPIEMTADDRFSLTWAPA